MNVVEVNGKWVKKLLLPAERNVSEWQILKKKNGGLLILSICMPEVFPGKLTHSFTSEPHGPGLPEAQAKQRAWIRFDSYSTAVRTRRTDVEKVCSQSSWKLSEWKGHRIYRLIGRKRGTINFQVINIYLETCMYTFKWLFTSPKLSGASVSTPFEVLPLS